MDMTRVGLAQQRSLMASVELRWRVLFSTSEEIG